MQNSATPIAIDKLHFDLENPRYGKLASVVQEESQALELIVSAFEVDDLLSSISVNGFFDGEPLIAKKRNEGGFTVIEGNRRLASLLILRADPRAIGQKKRHDFYAQKMKERGTVLPSEVPVILVNEVEAERQVLAYLGTKHIVGPSEWDSFAKAKWMADMRRVSELPLTQIKEMIGDTGGLVDRMLEGFYVIDQVQGSGKFDPLQSYVKGRGSNPQFPFSWIYTALNMAGVRHYLGIRDSDEPNQNPIPLDNLENAGDFFEMIFGNKAAQKRPVIKESRDLANLSKALTDPLKSARLRDGVALEIVEEEGRPTTERLAVLLTEAIERLSKANGLASDGSVQLAEARYAEDLARRANQAASSFRKAIQQIITNAEDEEFDG